MEPDEFMAAVPPAQRYSKLAPYAAALKQLRDNGYTLSQLCDFLSHNGVVATPSTVSSYLQRALARQRRSSHLSDPTRRSAEHAAPTSPPPPVASTAPSTTSTTPAPAPAPSAGEPNADNNNGRFQIAPGVYQDFKYGSHDPRRLDEIISRAPDLRAWRQHGLEIAAQKKREQAAAARAASASPGDPGVTAADTKPT
jgi:hypothetical protein